jgi:serpin B
MMPLDRRRFLLGSLAGLALLPQARLLAAPPPARLAEHDLVAGTTNAGMALCKQLGAENLIVSPLSIGLAFAMLHAGARGDTEKQIARLFGLGDRGAAAAAVGALTARLTASKDIRVAIANRLWAAKTLVPERAFLDVTAQMFGAALERVDFADNIAAAKAINAWVAAQTADKIKDLLPPDVLDASTRLVLTNAIYFKGVWEKAFDPKRTQELPFTLHDGKQVPMATMIARRPLQVAVTERLQVARFAYQGGYSMYVMLPREPDGLRKMVGDISGQALAAWSATAQQAAPVEVDLWLPKWTARYKASLPRALKALGLTLPFDGVRADLSGIASRDREALYVTDALHEGFIDVNEEGTEAAAATAIVVARFTSIQSRPSFKATHPFLYWIQHDDSRAVLFIGRLDRR